jgi:hypothetical protein
VFFDLSSSFICSGVFKKGLPEFVSSALGELLTLALELLASALRALALFHPVLEDVG